MTGGHVCLFTPKLYLQALEKIPQHLVFTLAVISVSLAAHK
jgi:hypothetical protein